MDNFKKFIQENKRELDFEKPDAQLWTQIKQSVEPESSGKKNIPIYRWIAAAACILVVSVSAYFFFQKDKSEEVPTFVKKETPIIEQTIKSNDIQDKNNDIPEKINAGPPKVNTPTFAKSEKKTTPTVDKKNKRNPATAQYVIEDVEVGNFSQIIAYERQHINTLPIYGQQASYFNDFKQQLKQMDADEKNVRSDIKKHGLNSNQIELLINIYQQKITLLKQLNQEINRINKSFYQNHLQKDSLKTDNPHFLNL